MSATSAPGAPVHRILATSDPVRASDDAAVDVGGSLEMSPAEVATEATCPHCGHGSAPVSTTSAAAEAEQGEGPAAASASGSAVGGSAETNTVSVVVGPQGASAACPIGVVVVGPHGAAAACEAGVVAAGPTGAAAACNAANGSKVTVDRAPTGATSESTPSPQP
jgi:hypothetical protein